MENAKYRSKIVIWSSFNPSDRTLVSLSSDAESGDAFLSEWRISAFEEPEEDDGYLEEVKEFFDNQENDGSLSDEERNAAIIALKRNGINFPYEKMSDEDLADQLEELVYGLKKREAGRLSRDGIFAQADYVAEAIPTNSINVVPGTEE